MRHLADGGFTFRSTQVHGARGQGLWPMALSLLLACAETSSKPGTNPDGGFTAGPGALQADARTPDARPDGASGPAPIPLEAGSGLPEASTVDGGSAPPPPDAGSGSDAAAPPADGGSATPVPFPSVPDFTKDGPFPSTTLMNTGPNGGYTVYLPMTLGTNGVKHPIVGWMSGGGTIHELYPLLPRLATQGFVVVAANVIPGIGDEANLGMQIMAGIDWAIAENARSGSMLFDKLNPSRTASMGYSMGSLATFMIASNPKLTTTVHISGGNMAAERINNLRQPAIFICGTPGPASCGILDGDCDIAATNCDTDFAGAKTPVFYANFAGGHLGILGPPTDLTIGGLAATWLRWKLMDDRSLDPKFLGDSCEVCGDKTWSKVQRKNFP